MCFELQHQESLVCRILAFASCTTRFDKIFKLKFKTIVVGEATFVSNIFSVLMILKYIISVVFPVSLKQTFSKSDFDIFSLT